MTVIRKATQFINIVRDEARDVFAHYSLLFGWRKQPVYSDTPIYDQLEREWARNSRAWL